MSLPLVISFMLLPHFNSNEQLTSFQESTPNEEVFEILELKCNACHKKKKSSPVFTLENMDREKLRINYQVFVKKRMPKGKKHLLTKEEETILNNWVKSKN